MRWCQGGKRATPGCANARTRYAECTPLRTATSPTHRSHQHKVIPAHTHTCPQGLSSQHITSYAPSAQPPNSPTCMKVRACCACAVLPQSSPCTPGRCAALPPASVKLLAKLASFWKSAWYWSSVPNMGRTRSPKADRACAWGQNK